MPLPTKAIVERCADLVTERYVFADVAGRIAERLRSGSYAGNPDAAELAGLVTADLQSINADRHLRLLWHEDELPPEDDDDDAAWMEIFRAQARESMGGVRRVERLRGDVGLLALAPMLFPAQIAGPYLAAAMQLLADVPALVIDLRELRGGDPGTVALICSYLVAEPTHINTMHQRDETKTMQSWTLPWVPGRPLARETRVYVLTGAATFSGGEELSYDLQQLGRATVVGEVTGGGANAREGFRIDPHLELSVPVVRPVNPVSGTNWEGVGVQPDVEVAAGDALDTAHELALAELATRPDLSPALRRELAAR